MDPDETLKRFLVALEAQDFDEAIDALTDLRGWLFRGGFRPQLNENQLLGLLDYACEGIRKADKKLIKDRLQAEAKLVWWQAEHAKLQERLAEIVNIAKETNT